MYHCHFREVVLLNLHQHLNCVFAHLTLFNDRFELIESRETEILSDLVVALKILEPDPQLQQQQQSESQSQSQTVSNEVVATINSTSLIPEQTSLLLSSTTPNSQEVIAQIGH